MLIELEEHASFCNLTRDDNIPYIVFPLFGRFKGETGELCHLLAVPKKLV